MKNKKIKCQTLGCNRAVSKARLDRGNKYCNEKCQKSTQNKATTKNRAIKRILQGLSKGE